jgi:phosphoglycolate phosphatase-like HAD superfamily hydrolase
MSNTRYTLADLQGFQAQQRSFVGVDSDGCVFPTMDAKQKEHFHPLIIQCWGLEKIEPQLRASAEFVNLYSKWRGKNRFPNLLLAFELLHDWDEVRATGVRLPDLTALRAYCNSGLPLGNPTLRAEVARTRDPELQRLLDWSLAVNVDIDQHMRPAPPFPWAIRSLEKMQGHSDLIVVSQTPEEALIKEWEHHHIDHLVRLIAGQELGTKTEHIRCASQNRYPAGQVLMIGDAPGDYVAAQDNQAAFFPILPGHEDQSWQRFHDEAYDLFLQGNYTGSYADRLIREFQDSLSDTPPWKKYHA